ncbi:ribonuclease R [Geobacter sp. DSM 9736]|uniref:ribonuclease R n=1 Tax=Geobacter sp. DSM 9736 TaxID=1277350 RepID=UPI000B510A61|nr:ribonuclease R [Geobacter sp. DSM 9736]SNB45849.1 RNAse R [Geobacter sp. DSM 9736]
MKISKSLVIKLMRQNGGSASLRELMGMAGADRGQRLRVRQLVEAMADEGEILRVRGNRYALQSASTTLTGKLSTHRDGYGFVSADDGGGDIFIPARYLRETMHGDQVEVAVLPAPGEGKREGRIVRIVQRAHTKVVGRLREAGKAALVIPEDLRLSQEVSIPARFRGAARDGQVVVAEIDRYPVGGRPAEGRIVEVLGFPEDPEVEVRTIIAKYELPVEFSPESMKAARSVSQSVSEADVGARTDLRSRLTVTIDGETARDFDDAVAAERVGDRIRLWVSIADVSHYVRPGSALDRDAYERGTSVYFPDRAIPMLPEELSNGICSLNPLVDRLALTAELLFDASGSMVDSKFYPSVIRSAARLTYTTVRRLLVDQEPDIVESHRHLLPDLLVMQELALILMEKRRRRGSIDFDLPEPQLVLDLQGGTMSIVRAERNLAHRIIEEFMLAANESVASFLEKRNVPSLYRVHEPPDMIKLRDFREFISGFGYDFRFDGERVDPAALQLLLDQAAGKPEERLINEVLLRSMKQARYSAENLGHFGLAASCYTHFTSPIRRYPDLQVHRILKGIITGTLKKGEALEDLAGKLPDMAIHCSSRERTATEAEREIVDLKKVQFMRGRIGEQFDGFITGVTSYGLFVELIELFVEGMVHVSTMPHDFYRYEEQQHAMIGERSRRTYRLGDRVRVIVAGASLERRQIDFVLAGEDGEAVGDYQHMNQEREEYVRVPVKGKRPVAKGTKPGGGGAGATTKRGGKGRKPPTRRRR